MTAPRPAIQLTLAWLCVFFLSACTTAGIFTPRQAVQDPPRTLSDQQKQIIALEQEVADLKATLKTCKQTPYTLSYTRPETLYHKARNLLLEGDIPHASQLFKTFLEKHPRHSLADNAMYWLGECHYTSGEYQKAVAVFKRLVQTYPKADKVPDAILKTGFSYLSMDDLNRARHFLKTVIRKHPFSPAAQKAQDKLKEIQ